MRGQKHVATHRLLGQQIVQAGRLQIAGQENSPPETLHRQHEAVGVVRAENTPSRRVQHFNRALAAPLQAVAGVDFPHHYIVSVEGVAQHRQQAALFLEHDRRHVNHPDRKPFQQLRQGVEVVGVGVRDHHGVDVRESLMPEELGDRPGAADRRAEPAGVVEHRLARGQLQQHRAAVPHAEERTIEPIVSRTSFSR